MLVTVGTLPLAVTQVGLFWIGQVGELAMQLTVVVGLGRHLCFLVCPPLAPSFLLTDISCVLLSTCQGSGTWQAALFLISMFMQGKDHYPRLTTGKLRSETGHPAEMCVPL